MAVFPTNNYDPRLIIVDEMNGSTLTRAAIRAFTKEDFATQGLKEVGMDRIIAATKEARLAGVKERSLMDLLLSRHVALGEQKGATPQSIIAPYDLIPRENVVNANYFTVDTGAATAGAGQGSLHPGAWSLTVKLPGSDWYKAPSSGLKNLEKYFLPGGYLVVEYADGSNVSRAANFKIISATNADSGSTSKAIVILEPNKTVAGWNALSGGDKAVWQPTAGTVTLLANSVSDYESYGHQFPAYLSKTLIEYWRQTHRWASSYSEEYLKALNAPLTSDFFKKFRSLPIAKQRAQQEMINQNLLFNTFFYGEEINEKQTVDTWTQLPQVYDPADAGFAIEYKANTLGVRRQLAQNARVSDKAGAALNLDTIFESLYNLKRNRETGGNSISVIDGMTDRYTGALIRDMMMKYYKQKYSMDVTGFFQPGQKVLDLGTKAVVLEYNLYDIPDQGVQFAVFTDTYFDDRIAAFNSAAAQKKRGRSMWMIDWSDVAINVVRTNSAKRTTNVADELYRYVITPNVKQTMLNSKTFEVRVGDTNRHSMIENFSDATPTLTIGGGTVTAPAGS